MTTHIKSRHLVKTKSLNDSLTIHTLNVWGHRSASLVKTLVDKPSHGFVKFINIFPDKLYSTRLYNKVLDLYKLAGRPNYSAKRMKTYTGKSELTWKINGKWTTLEKSTLFSTLIFQKPWLFINPEHHIHIPSAATSFPLTLFNIYQWFWSL